MQQKNRVLLTFAFLELTFTVINMMHPILTRVFLILEYAKNPHFEVYSQVMSYVFKPLAMFYEVTCFCYFVYRVSKPQPKEKTGDNSLSNPFKLQALSTYQSDDNPL